MSTLKKNKVVPGNMAFAEKLRLMSKSSFISFPMKTPVRKEGILPRAT